MIEKTPIETVEKIERVMNKIMPKKYSWWKDIFIDQVDVLQTTKRILFAANLTVDKDWAAKQWNEFHYSKSFPGNFHDYEESEASELVSLGDIVDSQFAREIEGGLTTLISGVMGDYHPTISIRHVYLYFV